MDRKDESEEPPCGLQLEAKMFTAPKSQTPEALIEYEIKQLFERHTIPEIRVREQTTRFVPPERDLCRLTFTHREEIEAKSQDLRKLVGTRYRDLIDSADSVIAMKDAATQMSKKIEQIEGGCHSLISKVRKQDDPQVNNFGKYRPFDVSSEDYLTNYTSEDRTLQRRKMYHLARQIKLLVDAPEQVIKSLTTSMLIVNEKDLVLDGGV